MDQKYYLYNSKIIGITLHIIGEVSFSLLNRNVALTLTRVKKKKSCLFRNFPFKHERVVVVYLFKCDDRVLCVYIYMYVKVDVNANVVAHTTMVSVTLAFVILYQFSIGECFRLWDPHTTNVTQPFERARNNTTHVAKTVPLFNETTINTVESQIVDCFGLGETVAAKLESLFSSKPNGSDALDVQFRLSSRKRPRRVHVVLGEQFGLEWADFKIERRTVIIVHGFLSHSQETWISDMEQALLEWDDVNVVIIDWSAGGNTLNYYKAVVNTRIVGYQVSKFIEHVTNATINNARDGSDVINWGPLHLIGHSLGAHICGFAAKELKKRQNRWTVSRITGLDPAQPCFRKADASLHLHKNDAPFVDVIHTNGQLLTRLGLGLPETIGHVDFYPNGGKTQPGCIRVESSYFTFWNIPRDAVQRAICSHGRSYDYLTESLRSATARNCSFWAHQWNLTYRHFLQIIEEPCDRDSCTEMGIKAEMYDQRGSFFVATANTSPFCANSTDVIEEVKRQMQQDYFHHMED
ncbi:pancreatic triacylglycerol lipase [Solenopsis invicta]|uniref:pancreatic triacylglycerol lipase n=1 Tax=Solenopsis invicta TaxID=13686 RepID=UPI00193D7DBF|nr:pancreatic triacylglycerol lipase [Solenopsis invicta]